ncbi:hypothetical protein ACROYT_G028670 [Oculina patagonica]
MNSQIIFLSETKIDKSYSNSQFTLTGYNMYRKDRKKGGGGMIAYFDSSLPSKELKVTKKYKTIETLAIEARLGKNEVIFLGIYRPPTQSDHQPDPHYLEQVEEELNDVCMWASLKKQISILTGDLNLDRLKPKSREGRILADLEEVHGMQCLITKPTRITLTSETLLDVILTNKPNLFRTSGSFNSEISDHHLIYGILKQSVLQHRRKTITFKSLKNVDVDQLNEDLASAPWIVGETFDAIEDQYDAWKTIFESVLDKHMPKKKMRVRQKDVPYMTEKWKMAIRNKRKYAQMFAQNRSLENWELKRKWRNLATKERRRAIKAYWAQKSEELRKKPRDFYKTFKPFLSDKTKEETKIAIRINDRIVTNQKVVADELGDYFSTAANAIGGCEGVAGIADDIVVFGKTTEEHDRNMHAMLERCQGTGLKLNPEKCFVKQEKFKFYGVVCGKEGIQPDPSKVSAIKQMSSPTNRQELQTFLGLANYMGPFIPKLSSLTAPLRELLKENYQFQWSLAHQDAFEKVKDSVSNEVTLTYFDPRKEIILQVDASLKGLGATLMQESKPVAFASKSLTDVETRYANIERELLAVVYGGEEFHTYLFGHSFTVHSDHKPLESIYLKHLTAASPRLQRMLQRLQLYDLVIRYQPGKSMEVADALSRLSPEEKEAIPGMNVEVHGIYPQFSEDMLQRIRDETAADPELNALKEMVHLGLPSTIQQVSALLKPYWPFRDELAVEDGIAMKGHRIIIPPPPPRATKRDLNNFTAHQGTEKTNSAAMRGLNKDIDEITKSCITCQELQPSQQKEPLIPTEVPPRAWHTLAQTSSPWRVQIT